MEAVNTAPSSQGLQHPKLQVPALNPPPAPPAPRLGRGVPAPPPFRPPAPMLPGAAGLSTHPSGRSTHRGTPQLRAKTMPWCVIQMWRRLCSRFRICPHWDHGSLGRGRKGGSSTGFHCGPSQPGRNTQLLFAPEPPAPRYMRCSAPAAAGPRVPEPPGTASTPRSSMPRVSSEPSRCAGSPRPPAAGYRSDPPRRLQRAEAPWLLWCFLALVRCLWLLVSILKAIRAARAMRFVSSGSSRRVTLSHLCGCSDHAPRCRGRSRAPGN